jgi:hypothetical protein
MPSLLDGVLATWCGGDPRTYAPDAAARASPRACPQAKSVCGETDRINPARMSGPRDRPRRAASATSADRVCHLLSWGANTSRLGERRADDTTRSDADGRARGRVLGSWRITSSLRTTRSLTGSVDPRLSLNVRLRVCGERPRACASRVDSRLIVFVTASAREASAASRNGFGEEGLCFSRLRTSVA